MIRPIAPRSFERRDNRLKMFLHEDHWTTDVPLPPHSRVLHLGEHHEIPLYSKIEFVLEPDQTREIVSGYFEVPLAFKQAVEWFQRELAQIGWEADSERSYHIEDSVHLYFRHPDTSAEVDINVRWWQYRHLSTAMIRREVVHPCKEINTEELIQDSVEFEPEPEALNS